MNQKTCTDCGELLPLENFRATIKRGKPSVRSKCRACDKPKRVDVVCQACSKTYSKQNDRLMGRWTGLCRSCSTKKQLAENPLPKQITHGMTHTRIYNVWRSMLKRCSLRSRADYSAYGGRGIKVCSDWGKFEPFRDWAYTHGYSDALTLERIDVNGNYEPSNCCWIPMQDQHKNKRSFLERGKGVKFLVDTIRAAKQDLANKMPAKAVAKKYAMSLGYVYHLRSGRVWKEIV